MEGKKVVRSDLYFKVEIEHEPGEKLERRGEEICRQVMKLYGVRSAEMTNYVVKTGD